MGCCYHKVQYDWSVLVFLNESKGFSHMLPFYHLTPQSLKIRMLLSPP